jgi:hypothetical protein
MVKRPSGRKATTSQSSASVDPLSWVNLRTYGELKEWLRDATQQRIFVPVVIPHNVMPSSYLAQLLRHSEPRIKAHLRTIIPELIREWGAYDDRQCLNDLLILCGNLNCNEAEIPIAAIVTDKLTHNAEDTELRVRALSVLQAIGTSKSLHLFKRYIGEYAYAAVCYRSLYRQNLDYAVTELPDLMNLYHSHDAAGDLEDVLKILFKYTLKPQEFICVLQPLVEQVAAEYFIEVLEILHSIDVLNKKYFERLPSKPRAEMIKEIMKRVRKEDGERISALLKAFGVGLEPPPYHKRPQQPVSEETEAKTKQRAGKKLVKSKQGYFEINVPDQSTGSERVPLDSSELSMDQMWPLMREFTPDQNFDTKLSDMLGG